MEGKMSETNKSCPDKWAILEFMENGYMLRENGLAREDAETLSFGKYSGRDIILTVSSEDLSGRICGLNRSIFACGGLW